MGRLKNIINIIYRKKTEFSRFLIIFGSVLLLTYLVHLYHLNTTAQQTTTTQERITTSQNIIINNTTTDTITHVNSISDSIRTHKQPADTIKIKTPSNVVHQFSNHSKLISLSILKHFLWFLLIIGSFYYYLKHAEEKLFEQPQMLIFVMINLLGMVGIIIWTMIFYSNYLYIVPFSILTIVIRVFWSKQLAFFMQNIALLCLLFIVPNYLEFFVLSFMSGTVSILSKTSLYKRNSLIWTIVKIVLVYSGSYSIFYLIKFDGMENIDNRYFILFLINGLLTFLVYFIIWVYEKTFGMLSELTLLELSNTSNPLLKMLNEKAPGTFQHTMQVVNLAEDVANHIGADAMLTKVGALYHDIGKVNSPSYFIENQITSVNPHDEITPQESANIIIEHVVQGVELAKKYRLPEQIVDFIRSHHGKSLVYFFYRKQCELDRDVNENDFRYNGILPFSKETVILMMCDSVEAACRSLKTPTAKGIEQLIDRIVDKQIMEQQYVNAPITLAEINTAKIILKQKIKSIYHSRIVYPT